MDSNLPNPIVFFYTSDEQRLLGHLQRYDPVVAISNAIRKANEI